jgi:hypothetical protein
MNDYQGNLLKVGFVMSAICMLAANCLSAALAQNAPSHSAAVNQDSVILHDFNNRVEDYLKLRKRLQADAPSPKTKESSEKIKQSQLVLAQKIRAARSQAKQGDIFSPKISQVLRKLLAGPLRGDDGSKIQLSLRDAEREHPLKLGVNQSYPGGAALPSPPPTLLMDLPKLPPELEYRIIGRQLVLRDEAANLIVDFLPDALPAGQAGT